MDRNEYIQVARFLVISGWSLTFIVWVGYSAVAPWYKYSAGRYIWGLLTALLALFTTVVLGYAFDGYPLQRELVLVTLLLYSFSMLGMGVGIYKAQILRYHKAKFIKSERERHKSN